MNQLFFPQSAEFSHGSPISQNGLPTGISTLAEDAKAVEAPLTKPPHKTGRPAWKSESDKEKEIIVPFDESSFSGLLVDNKTFQDAYSIKTHSPPRDNLRLDAERTIGALVRTPSSYDDMTGFLSGMLFFVEILLLGWTAVLLMYYFPISKWLAWSLLSLWSMTLITFKLFMMRPISYRVFLWCGTSAVTLFWLFLSP